MRNDDLSRREVLRVTAITGTGILLVGCAHEQGGSRKSGVEGQKPEEDVSPAEDLMREHGILKRVMLIYDDIAGRIEAGKDFPPEVLAASANIIRSFVEDYHEKLEENFLFPRFEK